MTGDVTRHWLAVAVLLSVGVGCAGEPDDGATTTTADATTTTADATTTTAPATTTTAPATTTTAPATTTTVPYPATTLHVSPADCDVDGMLATVDEVTATARLATGTAWELDGVSTFDARTNEPEEFRDRLALDCRLRAVQRTDAGDRLLVAAWTGARHAFVVQSSDRPSTPYAPDQNLQLLYEQPYGEWLVAQEVWAGTLEGGETVIVAVDDFSLGATAKAWQALPRWEDIPVTIETERYAIDVLLHAGARNVSPGEPPPVGSTIAAIQFVTPLGLPLIATVAPLGEFDHTAPIVEGERSIVEVAGTEVHLTRGAPDSYAVAAVGWQCGRWVWFIDSVWGTTDELVDWAAAVIAAARCDLAR